MIIELSIIELLLEGKIDGKRKRGRPRRQWEIRDTQDIFDMFVTEVGRLAIGRNCFCSVVKDATSYGDKQSAVSSQGELSDLKERFSIGQIQNPVYGKLQMPGCTT